MHQSNHTPEQRGVDANYRANFLWGFPDDSIEMIGYEFANGKTEEYLKVCWDALLDKVKSTSEPLPSKGQEGEAERRAWELVDKFNKDKIVCIDYCNKMIDVESSYIETPYGVDQIRFWQQVRNNIVNL